MENMFLKRPEYIESITRQRQGESRKFEKLMQFVCSKVDMKNVIPADIYSAIVVMLHSTKKTLDEDIYCLEEDTKKEKKVILKITKMLTEILQENYCTSIEYKPRKQ
jgi:hypothetical protein